MQGLERRATGAELPWLYNTRALASARPDTRGSLNPIGSVVLMSCRLTVQVLPGEGEQVVRLVEGMAEKAFLAPACKVGGIRRDPGEEGVGGGLPAGEGHWALARRRSWTSS